MTLGNSYLDLPDRFYVRQPPASVPAPAMLAWNEDLAAGLGLGDVGGNDAARAAIFSGNEVLPGSTPIALAYAGHQFGQFVPQLGDGRALLLGDVPGPDGRRYDVQLKGSGRTPFSRGGDGKATIGPVIREYLLSEAMHRLGVPTTRALAAVTTGESILRERMLPGAVLTRVAGSHVRVGTFQFFAARDDTDALQALVDFALRRHYPAHADADAPCRALFACVADAQATLVARWMALGFIHGVMNTDNTSIAGETIDYGPCAFMDEFLRNKVFSSIDHRGRYAYRWQPTLAQWNLARLAECLLMLDDDTGHFERAVGEFMPQYERRYRDLMLAKFGLDSDAEASDADRDQQDDELIDAWLEHLQRHELDYTLSFRDLAAQLEDGAEARFGEFESRWRQRLAEDGVGAAARRVRMDAVNPLYIPRNHQVERAIEAAIADDLSVFESLKKVLAAPFEPLPGYAEFARAPQPEQRVLQTFCGT